MKKVFVLLLVLFSTSIIFAATDVAVVNSVVGKVEVQVNDSWIQLKNGDILTGKLGSLKRDGEQLKKTYDSYPFTNRKFVLFLFDKWYLMCYNNILQ
jgi:hypothetical protein